MTDNYDMKSIAVERQIIQTNIESLSQIEWTSQNDEKAE
jgi:hypothetical protein